MMRGPYVTAAIVRVEDFGDEKLPSVLEPSPWFILKGVEKGD